MSLRNDGVLRFGGFEGQGEGPRTILVTGLRGSGLSMVAGVLHGAGVPLGAIADKSGFDDLAFEDAFASGNAAEAIAGRDARDDVWGFKFPDLQALGDADQLALLRRPLVIAIARDPMAIASRRLKSGGHDEFEAVATACRDASALHALLGRLGFPTLLLSYEKALLRRPALVDTVLGFCGLRVEGATRTRLIAGIEASPIAYAQRAPRRFDGHIDGVSGAHLFGWCTDSASHDPVWVSLVVDGKVVRSALAAEWRADLEAGGVRDGRCAFSFDVVDAGAREDSVVEVRLEGKRASVNGGGQTVATLRAALTAALERHAA